MAQRAPYVGVTVSKFEGMMPSSLIRRLRFLGMNFFELNASIFSEIDKVAASVGSIKTSFHLPLIAENGWDFSCSDFQNEIDTAIETLNSYRDKLNIQHVVCHPPEDLEETKKLNSSLDVLIKNLDKLDLPIHLENVPSIDLEAFQDIYSKAKESLGDKLDGICFDAPHFFIRGFDPIEKFNSLNGNISSIHLSDCLDDKDEHIPFESGGTLPVHEFLQAVRNSKFNRSITLEIRPTSLSDLDSYISSYLTTLQYVNTKKYAVTKLRILALRPFIKRFAA